MFPQITGRNLENEEILLPNALKGEINLLIIAFKKEQQALVDGWIPFLKSLAQKYPRLAFYELPTLSSSYSLIRWMIDGGMRAGIPDKKARERTITLYTNKREFRKKLRIPDEDTIHVLLLGKNGEVIWRNTDRFTGVKGQSLEKHVQELHPH